MGLLPNCSDSTWFVPRSSFNSNPAGCKPNGFEIRAWSSSCTKRVTRRFCSLSSSASSWDNRRGCAPAYPSARLVSPLTRNTLNDLGSIGDGQAVKPRFQIEKANVPPIVRVPRDKLLEKVRINDVHAVQPDHLGIDLVARRGERSQPKRALLRRPPENEVACAIIKAEILIRGLPASQFLRGQARLRRQLRRRAAQDYPPPGIGRDKRAVR